jgi:hypothetical protein
MFVGLWSGSTTILVNAFVEAVVTQIPPILKRDYDIPMDPALTLWITGAVFLHAFGVVWEVIEFGPGELARLQGNEALLTQHGLEGTMLDLVFDTVGAVIIAIWGTVHLNDVSGCIAAQLDARTSN